MPIDLAKELSLPAYTRSATYDAQSQVDTMIGPNVLWLTESVTNRMHLEPDFWSFHSAAWWRRHLERTGPFEVGYPPHFPHSEKDIPFPEDDMGKALALVEVVARKP